MKKIVYFLGSFLLIIFTFCAIVLTGLLYRATEKTDIKTYIFQNDDLSENRIGELQSIKKMGAIELRNRLINRYIAEYFSVYPYQENVANRPILKSMSESDVFDKWKNDEAKNISEMSQNGVLRLVSVYANSIEALNEPKNYNYYDDLPVIIRYNIRYETRTWLEPNNIELKPLVEYGTFCIDLKYKPEILEKVNDKRINIKKELQKGRNPATLFKFTVTGTECE